MSNIPCNKIPHDLSKSFYRQTVTLQENATGLTFQAVVVDYCFEDQCGFIVRIEKEAVKNIVKTYNMGESDGRPDTHVECDLRDIFFGKHFTMITQLH